MDVDDVLSRPREDTRGLPVDLPVLAVLDAERTLDAREVHAPWIAGVRRYGTMRLFAQREPRHRDLDGPPAIDVGRVVQRAVQPYRGRQSQDLPVAEPSPPVAIGTRQEQIPGRVARVDIELVVFVIVAVGIDEELESVLLIERRIVAGHLRPEPRSGDVGGDVQMAVVPEHLHAGPQRRFRRRAGCHVAEVVGPRRGTPGGLVETAIDRDGPVRADAHVSRWMRQRRWRLPQRRGRRDQRQYQYLVFRAHSDFGKSLCSVWNASRDEADVAGSPQLAHRVPSTACARASAASRSWGRLFAHTTASSAR